MKSIASIIKASNQGVSRPFLCKDENGGTRWCVGEDVLSLDFIRNMTSEEKNA